LVDEESDRVGQRLLIDRVLATLGGGMDIAVHGRQAEGCNRCIVIIIYITIAI